MPTDYYKILGVPRVASADEIKKAYRKLAHQHHPDKKGGNEVKFKEINEAYQVLSDTQKRTQYDQFGQVPPGGFGSGGNPFGGAQGGFGGFDFSQGDFGDVFDMFGDLFGRGRSGSRSSDTNRGADLEIALEIDFRDSIRGAEKKIEFTADEKCQECEGRGAEKGSSLKQCAKCHGRGQIRQNVASLFGQMTRVMTCDECLGMGK